MKLRALFKVVLFFSFCMVCMTSCLNDDETKDKIENIKMYVCVNTEIVAKV